MSWDVAAAPPIKKYAREVRRKKTMLYIDSTSIQVMVPEERTAKYSMTDIKNVGYSVKQFFMVVIKARRRNAELLEFKTKEVRACHGSVAPSAYDLPFGGRVCRGKRSLTGWWRSRRRTKR
jgi:hypothetical protein